MRWVGYNIVALALLGIAVYMMYIHQKGPGWVIVLAVCCAYGPKTDDDKKEEKS